MVRMCQGVLLKQNIAEQLLQMLKDSGQNMDGFNIVLGLPLHCDERDAAQKGYGSHCSLCLSSEFAFVCMLLYIWVWVLFGSVVNQVARSWWFGLVLWRFAPRPL